MRKRLYEIMGIAPQFHEDGPPEYPAPPDEFNRFPPPEQETERAGSRMMRTMLLLGFSGLSAVGLLFSRANASAAGADPVVQVVSAALTESPSPAEAVGAAVLETPVPTEEPREEETPPVTDTPAPSDTPVPTDTPAPKETPAIDALYFCFSAEYHLSLKLSDAEELASCEVTVTDRTLGNELFSHVLTQEELAGGRYEMEPFWIDNYYMEHWSEWEVLNAYPDPVLSVTAIYRTESGETVLTKDAEATDEIGWTVRYDAPDAEANEYTYPGCLYFGTYETFGIGPLVAMDDPSVVPLGGISVSVTAGGVKVLPESCTVNERAFMIFDEPTGYYSTYVIIPLPEGAPEHGTARFTVTQMLTGGTVETFERDINY